jgi:predicted amidophosphoribosyltransferase
MILQTRCAGCDRVGAVLCRTCRFALAGPPPAVTAGGVIAAVAFVGRPRDIVLGLKYRNRRAVAGHLGGLLVNRLLAAGIRPGRDIDVVTWAPTSPQRRRRRGFDQAEAVARHVAGQLGVPARRLLERAGTGTPQTGRTRAARLDGPVLRARPDADGRRVLLVDDVVTTGATLRAGEATLLRAGARDVVLAAVASTPAGMQGGRVVAGPWPAVTPVTPLAGADRRTA